MSKSFTHSAFIAALGIAVGFAASSLSSLVTSSSAKGEKDARSSEQGKHFETRRTSSEVRELRPTLSPAPFEPPFAAADQDREDGGSQQPQADKGDAEALSALEPSMDEAAKVHLKEHEDAIELHRRTPRDASWAAKMEPKFIQNLGDIGKGKFQVISVDCRQSSCIAALEWPTFADATNNYQDVLHLVTANCRREIILPPPADPTRRYQATAVYTNCLPDNPQ